MTDSVRLLGHRGAPARAPENTLASLRRAMDDGANGVAFDIRLLRDGTAVLMRDETVDRTTTSTGLLASFDAVSLLGLDAGVGHAADFAGESVPTLLDVLDEFFGNAFLALLLEEDLPAAVCEALAERQRAHREAELVVASRRTEYLATMRDRAPAAPRALILEHQQPLPPERVIDQLGLQALFAHHEDIDERTVVECRRSGLGLWAYTVNEAETAARLAAWGITGILSDDPAAVRDAIPRAE